jgi:anti-sigma28 factor (negative regulator of flagellin synthesis)
MNRPNAAPLAVTTTLARIHWGLPSATARNTGADAIAENSEKLCLAGRLISWATAGNDVRFEKVATLRHAIESGAYKISSAALADKLMDGMRG